MLLSTPVVIWLGTTLWSMNTKQGELSGKIDLLAERISVQSEDRYRKSDADRDLRARDQKDAEHDRRLDRVDARIDRVEQARGVQGPH